MNNTVRDLFSQMEQGVDHIYGVARTNSEQAIEIEMREKVATTRHTDPLAHIAKHHSIPVMDFEVLRFLALIPSNGVIIDIGGCWGWHWRNVQVLRPDVKIFIVDFVRSNLLHAKQLLGSAINESIFLVRGDATALEFPSEVFDGIWTVQTFQHIPAYEKAVAEAYRVLKKKGVFANYSLNVQPHIRGIKRMTGKSYLEAGWIDGSFWLARASNEQKNQIEAIFGSRVTERWSEIFYSPELHFSAPGIENNWLGKLDVLLSNNTGFLSKYARQHSFHCEKL